MAVALALDANAKACTVRGLITPVMPSRSSSSSLLRRTARARARYRYSCSSSYSCSYSRRPVRLRLLDRRLNPFAIGIMPIFDPDSVMVAIGRLSPSNSSSII